MGALECKVLELVNDRRREGACCHDPATGTNSKCYAANPTGMLKPNAMLLAAATKHSEDMRDRDFFSHYNPDFEGPGDRITAAGFQWMSYAENIASGYGTPEAVMDGWMSSTTGHCDNVMSPGSTLLGVGIAVGQKPWGDHIYWTQKFGTWAYWIDADPGMESADLLLAQACGLD